MNTFSALNPISRRALKIPYESPLICQLAPPSSGSGAESTAILDILPTFQAEGPTLSVELDGVDVDLSWTAVSGAYAYIVYRATNAEGPYSVVTAGLIARNLVDNPGSGTFFYKVTGVEPNFGETTASNVVSVTVP